MPIKKKKKNKQKAAPSKNHLCPVGASSVSSELRQIFDMNKTVCGVFLETLEFFPEAAALVVVALQLGPEKKGNKLKRVRGQQVRFLEVGSQNAAAAASCRPSACINNDFCPDRRSGGAREAVPFGRCRTACVSLVFGRLSEKNSQRQKEAKQLKANDTVRP